MRTQHRTGAALGALFIALAGFAAPFPLSGTSGSLAPEAIEAALEEARQNDVDVSLQNAILYKGLMLFQDEEYAEAIPFLEEALRMDPALTAGLEALGWAYIRTERPERGYALWEYFATLMPDHWMPYNLLAQAAVMKQDWNQADAMFRKALEIKPDLYDQRYWFGQNLLRLGKIDEGEQVFRDLIAIEPGRLDIQIDLANVITYQFEYEEATKIWRHINEELPGNPGFMMNQAELELRIGEVKTADRLCREVLEIEDVGTLYPNDATRAMNLRVDIAELQDATAASMERLAEIIDETEDPVQRSHLRLRQANRYRQLQKRDPKRHPHEPLLEMIREAIRDNPYSLEARVLYAEQCVIAKRFYAAQRQAAYVLERFNKDNIRAKDVLFECALVERRFADAEQILLDRYATSDPTSPLRHIGLARVRMARGDYNEALKELDVMESAAQRGTVLTLLYHGLTESDWIPLTSARRLREHVNALQDAGFVFVSPLDIPRYAGLREGESALAAERKLPWLARTIDSLVYQVSGYRRFRPEDSRDFRDEKPMKRVAITFDDGLRSSFMLGSEVAQYAGAPFGMFVITKPQKDYQPAVGGWEEFRKAVQSGNWIIGSHLYDAHNPAPVDREGRDVRLGLPNRLWLPEKNRIESMNEWDARMRREFALSRQILKSEMREFDSAIPFCAYPYGDIGQESTCNLVGLRNPLKSIIGEAARHYSLGFVQSPSGYTTVGDSLMLSRRYEPRWNDEGADVVSAVYETHPVFLARKTRVDLALLMNKPHMAEKMLFLLRRDGYPEALCREIEADVREHFRNIQAKAERPLVAARALRSDAGVEGDSDQPADPTFDPFDPDVDPDAAAAMAKSAQAASTARQANKPGAGMSDGESGEVDLGDESPFFAPDQPTLYGEVENTKAIDQFAINRALARAGFNLNPNSTLSGEVSITDIDQTVHPRWNAITNDMTKVLERDFDATKTDARLRYSHRMESGAIFSMALGMAQLELNHDDENTADLEDEVGSETFWRDDGDSEIVGEISFFWRPRNDMALRVFYARDLVQTAVKLVSFDSLAGVMAWRPFDNLDIQTRAQYWAYSDDNALFNMQGSALFEVLPDVGIHSGLEGYVISSSHGCDYYWTPYWDQRVNWLLRYQKVHQGYEFFLDFMTGLQREDGRPLRRRQDDGLSQSSDWGYIWGFRGKYEQRLNQTFTLGVEGNVNALRDYVDHQIVLGISAQF